MTHGPEFWLAYQFLSRGNIAPTTQLIELESPSYKLVDLEDVLEYAAPPYDDDVYDDAVNSLRTDIQVFRQGFVEPHFRPVTTWVRKDGAPVHPSDVVEELIKQNVGKCPESAIKLVVEDAPTTLWFTYHYVHNPTAKVSIQRVRLNQGYRFEHLAHLTNYVFAQGYLPGHYRPLVHWETPCGKKLGEDMHVADLLGDGFGVADHKAIKLIIDAQPFHHHPHHHHHIPSPCEPHHPHHLPPCSPRMPSPTVPSSPTCHIPSPIHNHHHNCPF
ncbi:hypothetical protein AGABI2DRAFT_193938 [Agaricus bisporus var. bisporus H97]|uniref:hypothetical protein n=1 Tax=Agaricus bisporus var. bisporus (strain H97 / ATCC MYA-4626 / FGSC 10389) TaxID=936046 RepID=UPI00029F5026|nr:hypothetical protein AGABI2DRAFT_193938 [Agaricus bisporus var. bisporus H97]EKV46043.1 hypothetical protein AGABI2DRAFT_193938 [Agaricus bisporus var. bisporus H97]